MRTTARRLILLLLTITTIARAEEPPNLQDQLLQAARDGSKTRIDELVQQGANPFTCDRYGNSPFGIAAWRGPMEAAEMLLTTGTDVNQPSEQRYPTPLMAAAMAGKTNLIARLLDMGAILETKRCNGRTALIMAAQSGRTEAVRLLLERGADITVTCGIDHMNALIWAMYGNHPETAALLLEKGADPGPSPLMGPARKGQIEIMELFFARGFDMNAKMKSGMSTRDNEEWLTPIHAATSSCQFDAVLWLLDHGVPIETPGEHGNTPLMCVIGASAETHKKRTHVARELIRRGAFVNATNDLGTTPLMDAAMSGNEGMVKLLLEHDADVTMVNKLGMTALDYAAEWDKPHISELLVEAKAKAGPNTLIRAAVESQSVFDNGQGMQAILDTGININSRNGAGDTALMWAVKKGRRDNVQWLLKHGADPNIRNNEGKTAHDFTKDEMMLTLLETAKPRKWYAPWR